MNEYEVMQQKLLACEYEIGREIIGQKEIVRSVLLAILSGGTVLLENTPLPAPIMAIFTVFTECILLDL